MPALFPNSVRIYTRKTDLVDTVLADHVNLLQDELTATQNTLGTGLLSSVWAGTFSTPSTHSSVSSRILNIEAGLIAKANSLSPSLTGTPTAPTASADTNSTQIATTAFVLGQASNTVPAMSGSASVGTSTRYARADHVHATDTSRAPIASPTFTGTVTLPLTQGYLRTSSVGAVSASSTIPQSDVTNLSTDLAARVSRSNGTMTTAAVDQNVVRNITLSTLDPTSGQGSAGDVWLRYV